MRAISLVLLSIAIMALLLTDADAKRRSGAQGSQAAGASGSWCARPIPVRASTTTAAIPGPRRLLPTQSVSGHAIRDRLHLVRSEALELRRVRRQ